MYIPRLQARGALLFVLALLLPALSVGCGDAAGNAGSEGEATAEPEAQPVHTLVFIDRSRSAGTSQAATDSLFADSLGQIVQQDMRRADDRISLFPLHEKTASKAGRLDLRNNVTPAEQKDFASEQTAEDARHKGETLRFLSEAEERVRAHYLAPPKAGDFSGWTDLWGSLGVIGEELSASGTRRQVYYFSDMFESMPGTNRRNFDRAPPQNRQQARQWAAEDASRIGEHYPLDGNTLRNISIRVLQGDLATKEGARAVKAYWRTLFEELGVPATRIRYN